MRSFFVVGFVITLGFIILFSSNERRESASTKISRAPSSTPPKEDKSTTEQKQTALAEIVRIEKCYQSSSCDYPQTDSRSYSFAVGKDLAEKLAQFHAQFRQDPAVQKELADLARHAFKIEDGFVQSVALDMFKDLPTDAVNLEILAEGLKDNPDPLIAEKALSELQRYMNTPQEPQMQATVQSLLGSGAHFASQKVGENILGFINDRSFPSYQHLQQQLPAQSRVARDLAGALREYHRQRTGG